MNINGLIRNIELFEGLTNTELDKIVKLCQQRRFKKGNLLAIEGEAGNDLFIITEGSVEILLDKKTETPHIVVNLGVGQIIGEMSLVDRGPRSATIRATQDPTIVQVIQHHNFQDLCEDNHRIGYIVMKNMAADLSFKLRHRHLSEA